MEVAVPILALGGLYLVSNQEKTKKIETFKNKEGFSDLKAPTHNIPVNITGRLNVPLIDRAGAGVKGVSARDLEEEVAHFPAPNNYGDRYFQEHNYQEYTADWKGKMENAKNGQKREGQVESIAGGWINQADFAHNNMQPYFGAKVRQSNYAQNTNEYVLDMKQGTGSQHIQKQEQAPLFRPEENMHTNYGMASQTDFIQSRINPVMKMANVKPFESQQVGPGLGLGAGIEGQGGFNAGMEARELWMPKNVDDLRVATNPKVTYEGQVLGAKSAVQERGHIGTVEKNRPDTYFINSADRYFTTTGQEKAPTSRSKQVMKEQQRKHIERYGTGTAAEKTAGYVKPQFRVTMRPQLDAPITHASNVGVTGANVREGEYGLTAAQNSVTMNNRSTTEHMREGGISTFARAMIAPLLDVLRPSRKDNVIGNLREQGNVSMGGYGRYTINPADRTKTTIREMTEDNKYEMSVGNSGIQGPRNYTEAYALSYGQNRDTSRPIVGNVGNEINAAKQYDAVYSISYGQNRDTTSKQIVGTAGNNPSLTIPTSREAASNAYLIDKADVSKGRQPMGSNAPVFNGQSFTNVQIDKMDADRSNPRMFVPQGTHVSLAPARERYGELTARSEYGQNINLQRNQPEILDAFRSNPYTKPLNSY